RWLEISEAKRLAVKLEPMPEHVERAFRIQFLDQRAEEQLFQPSGVQRFHLGPQFRLSVLDECENLRREQGPILIPLRIAAGLPAAASEQDFLNVGLEGTFVGLTHEGGCHVSCTPSR